MDNFHNQLPVRVNEIYLPVHTLIIPPSIPPPDDFVVPQPAPIRVVGGHIDLFRYDTVRKFKNLHTTNEWILYYEIFHKLEALRNAAMLYAEQHVTCRTANNKLIAALQLEIQAL